MTENARELLSAAQVLLQPPADAMGSLSPGARTRAVAMLLRLALEQGLDDFWRGVAPGMTRTEKHRILCLEAYSDRGTARRWYLTWSALSGACHHRTHELPPSPAEIQGRLLEVNTLLDVLDMGAVTTAATAIAPLGTAADRAVAPPATPAARWAQGRRATRPAPKPGPPPGLQAAPPVVGGA